MAQKSDIPGNFWRELKRRRVIHVITVYAAIAFVILQLIDIVSRPLNLPDWTEAFMIVLLCTGFIIAVFLSWVYDITPTGVRKTKPAVVIKHNGLTSYASPTGWKIATLISVIVIFALIAFKFINNGRENSDLSKLEKSIAVLPFINDSPSDSNQYFINGVMAEILGNLQKITDFRVVSRTSANQYKDFGRLTIPEIARKLNVSYIVEGSGQKYGNKFVLRVQLITGRNERHLWSKSFDREIKQTTDIISIQAEIALSIAEELNATVTPVEKQLIDKAPTTSLTALDFYQKAEEELRKVEDELSFNFVYNINFVYNNRQGIKRAEVLYKKALDYDTSFAPVYAGLARVYWYKHFWKEYFSGNYMDSVLIFSNISLSYDNKTTGAYIVKGYYYWAKGILDKAIDEFDKALRINPNLWEAYYAKGQLYEYLEFGKSIDNLLKAASLNHGTLLPAILSTASDVFSESGFPDQAVNYAKQALILDADSSKYYFSLGQNEMLQGKFQNACEFYLKVNALDSNNIHNLRDGLGDMYFFLGQYKESLKYYKKAITKAETQGELSLNYLHRVGVDYWEIGNRKEAQNYFDKQIEFCNKANKLGRAYGEGLFSYYDLAGVYAFMGNKEKAFENLSIFNQIKTPVLWMVIFFKHDPLFNSIRNEPEFQQIAKDVESKYQAEHERVRKWLEEQGMLDKEL